MENRVPETAVSALQELTTLPLRADNPYIQQWQKDGGKVAGFTCGYVPEELIYAINGSSQVLPVRMGAQECETSEDADIYLHKFSCGYTRCLMQRGLDGDYDFLDGIVWTSCCEQLRRTFEHWRDEVEFDFASMIGVPHSFDGNNRSEWFAGELQNTVTTISEQYAGSISEESLRKSIKTFNRYRQLMQELYALRTEDKPKLSGAEAMQITQAGFAMPKEIFNDKLSLALEEIRQRSGHESRARLMICGSYLDDSFLIELIEETGATVVADTLCTGSRHFEGLVDEEADPFTAIADRYLNRISCPRMVGGYEQRLKFAKETAAAARVDGIIFQRLPFCDNHAVENMMEGQSFEDDSIPTLQLEREYLAADKGRLKTRIQAFLEKIGK